MAQRFPQTTHPVAGFAGAQHDLDHRAGQQVLTHIEVQFLRCRLNILQDFFQQRIVTIDVLSIERKRRTSPYPFDHRPGVVAQAATGPFVDGDRISPCVRERIEFDIIVKIDSVQFTSYLPSW